MVNKKNTLIANRYAEALVQIAKSGKLSFENVSANLNLVKETLETSKDLDTFLTNPIISIEDKKEIVNKVFADEINVLILNFLKVIIDKNRFDTFPEIFETYSKAIDDINNISRISVTSAVEMSKEAQARLKEKLELKLRKNVILDLNINTDIIAGLVINIGDNVIDMSLKNKLEDLSKNIIR